MTAPRENGRIIVTREEKYAVSAAVAAGGVRGNENSRQLSAISHQKRSCRPPTADRRLLIADR